MLLNLLPSLAHRPGLLLLTMLVAVVMAGLMAQVVAYRLGVPAIIFLLLSGIALGPDGLGIVQPALFSHGLRTIITGCVAIIVFESVLRIDLHDLKRVGRPVIAISTVGVLITTTLATYFAWAILGFPIEVAMLFGAIVSITGPTVIIPIVRRLSLSPRLKATLEGESVFADAVGVILAASIFGFITTPGVDSSSEMLRFLGNLALGAVIGASIAAAGKWSIRRLAPLPGEFVRLGVLGTALVAYTVAEIFLRHLGIMAVATAAIVFALRPLPYTETIKQFKGDLTLICLSLVFILLASTLRLTTLTDLGWRGVLVVALLMLVVRPACVFVSTLGSSLSWRERAFMAWLGPRGIVAASAAAAFALEFNEAGVAGADTLKGMVFLVVLLTVTIQGGGAPWVAGWLGVVPPKVFLLGGDKLVRRQAEALIASGEAVKILDENLDHVHHLLGRGLPTKLVRLSDQEALGRLIHPSRTSRIIIATPDEGKNVELARVLHAARPTIPIEVRATAAPERAAVEALGLTLWQSEAAEDA
jgi:NhaP-type Na+/H+ or K+/H+ antiporter